MCVCVHTYINLLTHTKAKETNHTQKTVELDFCPQICQEFCNKSTSCLQNLPLPIRNRSKRFLIDFCICF